MCYVLNHDGKLNKIPYEMVSGYTMSVSTIDTPCTMLGPTFTRPAFGQLLFHVADDGFPLKPEHCGATGWCPILIQQSMYIESMHVYTCVCCIHTYIHTLHYITLHYIRLHYTTLHYITLHYITLHCIA